MGQSSSRPRTTQQSTSLLETTPISAPTIQRDAQGQPVRSEHLFARYREPPRPRPPTSTPAPQDAAKRSRRQSMRDQLRALRPSSQPASVASSSQTQSRESSFLKKRWRSSRRYSKAPAEEDDIMPSTPLEGADFDRYGRARVLRSEEAEGGSSSGTLMHGSRPSTPFPVSGPSTPLPDSDAELRPELLSDEEQQASENIGAWLGGSGPPTETRNTDDINREVLDFLGNTQEAVAPNEDPREPEAHIEPPLASDTQQAPPRTPQFQAPSTLVVVQGVVNAQDPPPAHSPSQAHHSGSRSSLSRRSSSTPGTGSRLGANTEERTRSRNRLSSFIRPSSMLGRSATDDAASGSLNPDNQLADNMGISNETTADTDNGPQGSEGGATSPADSRSSRGLSAGSIDVLGTLLRYVFLPHNLQLTTNFLRSVAATATAASLFTPPTSALLSSNNTLFSPPPSIPTARPLSPTPTSGLGALNPIGGLGFHSPPQNVGTTADGRDRMRHAWDSIREMVGLNSRNTPEGGLPSSDASAPPSEPRMRTGDAMLADMARLLNAGLGLPPPSSRESEGAATGNASDPTSSPQPAESSPSPPAEGSFERFLLNLQTDLRNILSEDSEGSASGSTDDVSSSDPSSAAETIGSPSHSRSGTGDTSDSHVNTLFLRPPRSALHEATDRESTIAAHNQEQIEENTSEAEEDVAVRPRVPTPIPSMWSSTPAYSETRERVARAQRTGFADVPSRSRSQQPSSADSGPNRDERDRPVVNLWRLYRFAPIPATQAQENVSRTIRSPLAATSPLAVPVPAPSSPLAATTPEPSSQQTAHQTDESAQPPTSDAGVQTSAPEPTSDDPAFVVPVIVVGLQSVETRGQDDEDDGLQWAPPPRESPAGGQSRVPDHPMAWPSQPTPPSGSAGRSWGSRAANALRGLRPSARRTRTNRLGDGTGSRTFLIYVIGGK